MLGLARLQALAYAAARRVLGVCGSEGETDGEQSGRRRLRADTKQPPNAAASTSDADEVAIHRLNAAVCEVSLKLLKKKIS